MPTNNKWPNNLPRPLVEMIFHKISIDVTLQQNLTAFRELDFDIRLQIPVTPANNEPGEPDRYSLDGMIFEIDEAHAEIDDEEMLIDARIGFDKMRLVIRADDLIPESNYFAGETPKEPGEGCEPDYTGWYRFKFIGVDPLNWVLTPLKEGVLLKGRIDVEARLAQISARIGSALAAELTVRREALKVRFVDEATDASHRSVTETHRQRMSEVAARRSIGRGATEFLIHREPLSVSNS